MFGGLHRTLLGGAAAGPSPPSGSMLFFYDADFVQLSGSDITQWDDQSGNGFHATQGTSGNRASRNLADLNGHATATFNGTSDRYDATRGSATTPSAVTLVALTQRPGTSQQRAILDVSDRNDLTNRGFALAQDSANRIARYVLTDATYAFSSASWIAHILIASGTDVHIYEGTTLKGTTAIGGPVGTAIEFWRLGALFQEVWFWDSKIAQAGGYTRAWDATDRTNYIAYVNTRYGLSLT